MNIIHELTTGIAGGAPHKVGKACFSSIVTYHAASSASNRTNSISPSRRSSALSAANNSANGVPEDCARPWEPLWQVQTDLFHGYGSGSGSGGAFGSGGQGGSGRPGGGHNNAFPGDGGSSAQQFLFVGLKPDHASSFMGAVWHLLSVVCMMQTFGFLLYGDYGAADVFQDECFETVEI